MTTPGVERFIWAGLGAVLLAVVGAGAWSVWRGTAMSRHDTTLPVLHLVPEFTLTERSGRTISRADLAGHIWVADFIFTNCTGICPVLSARMARLQQALRGAHAGVRLVSFSVDPSRDTPDVLRQYAERYRADRERWLFLTGERDTLQRLIGEGFRLALAERSPAEAQGSEELITHSDRFVLVDRAARIRGYYRGTEEGVIPQLLRDIATLAAGSGHS